VNRALQKYLDAASGLTNLTAAKAERIVKGLVRSGEDAGDQVGDLVEELLERSKRNREALAALVKSETTRAVRAMGLATGKQVERLQKQVVDLKRELRRVESATGTEEASPRSADDPGTSAKRTAAKKTAAKKATAKKASAKKAAAKKASAKKATAKKTAAKKATAKKATAKKASAKKATAKKASAKKTAAKKASAKKASAKKASAKKASAKKATAKKATAVAPPEDAIEQAAARVEQTAATSDAEPRLVDQADGPPPEASPVLAEELRELTDGS
jgi:polyhydroxyalkanoate synthesis regulator phasin